MRVATTCYAACIGRRVWAWLGFCMEIATMFTASQALLSLITRMALLLLLLPRLLLRLLLRLLPKLLLLLLRLPKTAI